MDDPFDVRTAGSLHATCQIIHIGQQDGVTLIDLVALMPCVGGTTEFPAGTPLTVGFEACSSDEDRTAIEEVMGGWESNDAVIQLEVASLAGGICYQFTDGEEQLLVVLGELPPGARRQGG